MAAYSVSFRKIGVEGFRANSEAWYLAISTGLLRRQLSSHVPRVMKTPIRETLPHTSGTIPDHYRSKTMNFDCSNKK